MTQDFSRSKRLRSGADIRAITRSGERHQDNMFTIYARPNALNFPRLGVTVSRRVSLRANHRNRIKRAIRESFRCNQAPLAGMDIVVVARAAADAANTSILHTSLENLWKSVGKQ